MHGKFHCYLAQSLLEAWPISPAGSFSSEKKWTIFFLVGKHRKKFLLHSCGGDSLSSYPKYIPTLPPLYVVCGSSHHFSQATAPEEEEKSYFWDSATSPAVTLPQAHQFEVLWEGNKASWEHNMTHRVVGHALSSSQGMGKRSLTHSTSLKILGQASLSKAPQPSLV